MYQDKDEYFGDYNYDNVRHDYKDEEVDYEDESLYDNKHIFEPLNYLARYSAPLDGLSMRRKRILRMRKSLK